MKQAYKFSKIVFLLLLLIVSTAKAQYCTPTYSYGCAYGDGLTLFQLNTINQTIPCTGTPSYYHDYTALSTSLQIGSVYTITVQAGYSYTYVTVWIDYNHNNIFDPATETVGQVICTATATNFTIPFTVPGTALTGSTRLRAMTEYYAYPTGPCTAQTFGNCSDFTVNLTTPGYCIPVYSTGCTYGDGLTLFQLGTINQSISCSGTPPYYHDWTASSTNMAVNVPYTMTVQAGYSSTYVTVWIDLNNNYTFEAGEIVVNNLICSSSGVNYTAPITIPTGTTVGNHRLRFRTSWASTITDPCGSVSYGNSGDFTVNVTLAAPPTAVTTAATAITCSGGTLNGTVNANGSATTTSFDYGLTAAYGTTVAGNPASVSGSTATAVNAVITGLQPNTLYHYRIKGVNVAGTTNGSDMTFTTGICSPTASTLPASNVTNTTGTLNGQITAGGGSTTVTFDYGLTIAYGLTAAGAPSPVTGNTPTNVSANITGLSTGMTYHFRVRGTNVTGTGFGNDLTFVATCAAGAALPITGPTQVCQGGSGYIYTVPVITNATGYIWALPPGGSITAGANTNTITVSYSNVATSGFVSVYGTSPCGNGAPTQLPVNVNSPTTPSITGPSPVCATSTGNVYTTQANMINYLWTVSAGGAITAGGTTSSNTVTITWNTVGAQTVTVDYTNLGGCHSFAPAVKNVTVNPIPVPTIAGPVNGCSGTGGYVYSTQAGMTAYAWTVSAGGTIQSGSNTNSITVKWNTVGAQTVSVNYTNASLCTAAAPTVLNVTVNQGANPTITGQTNPCANSGYVIYSTETGMTAYTWGVSAGGTIQSGQGSNTVNVTWATAGNQSVSVNYSNASGCTAPSATVLPVTVNSVPGNAGAITGTPVICGGQTGVAYSVGTITGAATYVWTLPSGATIASGSGTKNISVDFATNATSGNITVYGNNLCGNGSTSPPYAVTVNALAGAAGIISGQATVCQGTPGVVYTVNPIANATSYTWTLPTGATIASGANTNTITVDFGQGAQSGNITVFGSNACGDGAVSPDFAVTVNPTPAAPVITLQGDLLSSNYATGNQWYYEGSMIPGATSQTLTVSVGGEYWDIVTLNGCSSDESNHILWVVGIEPLEASGFKLYPVPNDGRFNVTMNSQTGETISICVYNNIGAKIFEMKDVKVNGTVEQPIDLRPVPSGVYTVVFQDQNNKIVKKILVNK